MEFQSPRARPPRTVHTLQQQNRLPQAQRGSSYTMAAAVPVPRNSFQANRLNGPTQQIRISNQNRTDGSPVEHGTPKLLETALSQQPHQPSLVKPDLSSASLPVYAYRVPLIIPKVEPLGSDSVTVANTSSAKEDEHAEVMARKMAATVPEQTSGNANSSQMVEVKPEVNDSDPVENINTGAPLKEKLDVEKVEDSNTLSDSAPTPPTTTVAASVVDMAPQSESSSEVVPPALSPEVSNTKDEAPLSEMKGHGKRKSGSRGQRRSTSTGSGNMKAGVAATTDTTRKRRRSSNQSKSDSAEEDENPTPLRRSRLSYSRTAAMISEKKTATMLNHLKSKSTRFMEAEYDVLKNDSSGDVQKRSNTRMSKEFAAGNDKRKMGVKRNMSTDSVQDDGLLKRRGRPKSDDAASVMRRGGTNAVFPRSNKTEKFSNRSRPNNAVVAAGIQQMRGRTSLVKHSLRTAKGVVRKMGRSKAENNLKAMSQQKTVTKAWNADDDDDDTIEIELDVSELLTDTLMVPGPNYIPNYTDEERAVLYSDSRFVIGVADMIKEPSDIFIWELNDGDRSLRQFYPAKYVGRQFFVKSPVVKYFFDDYKSEEFYQMYQPIICIDTDPEYSTYDRKSTAALNQRIVQFVYANKLTLYRSSRFLSQFYKSEHIRERFLESLPIFFIVAILPQFIRILKKSPFDPDHQKFQRYMTAFLSLQEYSKELICEFKTKTDLLQETIDSLSKYPDLSYSHNQVDSSKPCSATRDCQRTPAVRVQFKQKRFHPVPYDHDTLEEHDLTENSPSAPTDLFWCHQCSVLARKFHRFYHFLYSLVRVVKMNLVDDIKTFRSAEAVVSDEILIWIMDQEQSWKNVMFMKFQLAVAELQAEIDKRGGKEMATVTVCPTVSSPPPILSKPFTNVDVVASDVNVDVKMIDADSIKPA